MPLGYWEAKDETTIWTKKITKKFRKGYPQDNIVFTDDAIAVLWQNRQEVVRCEMTDTKALGKLLKLFFGLRAARDRRFPRGGGAIQDRSACRAVSAARDDRTGEHQTSRLPRG